MRYQGKYRPSFPRKYKGDPTNIIYRSSWEYKFMKWCDITPSIEEWGSEEIIIPYISPSVIADASLVAAMPSTPMFAWLYDAE